MEKKMELMELEEAIERQRRRVDAMIDTEAEAEDFMRENRRLDQLIAEYIELDNSESWIGDYDN